MDDRVARLRIGPYLFVREIEPGRLADRWLAVHERDDTTFVVHRFRVSRDRLEQRRFVTAVESLADLDHPHLLPIVEYSLGSAVAGNAWIVTPFTGNQDGLITLDRLVREKGGRMAPIEVERSMIQLLDAVESAHAGKRRHGPIAIDEILVDRRGSLQVELYGLSRMLGRAESNGSAAEAARDEVRSVVELGYQLLTGLPADEPRIVADRLVPRLPRHVVEWLEAGLDPVSGFSSATEALEALRQADEEVFGLRPSPVRVVLGRVRQVLRSI